MPSIAPLFSSVGALGRMGVVALVLALVIALCALLPRVMLGIANGIRSLLAAIAAASAWLLVILMLVTLVDVSARAISRPLAQAGFSFPYTKLQELEWHLHAAVFSLWMGYNYVINAHPRVDSYFGSAGMKTRAWIELLGCLVFSIPYTLVIVYYGWDWLAIAYNTGEASDSATGLTHRWIIKGIYYVGLWLLLLGVLSVTMRLATHLFGRRTQEEAGLNLGVHQLEV